MISLVLILLGIFIYLKLNKFYQFTVLSLSALLPFTFGNLGSVPRVLVIEWITLVTLLMMLHQLAPAYSLEKKITTVAFKNSSIFLFALTVLFLWTIISLFNNEIFAYKSAFIRNDTGTKRTYFNIFNNITLFFTTFTFITVYFHEIDFGKYFKIILYTSISLGILRIITYFLDVEIPFLSGIFSYGGELAAAKYGGTAFRLGGLTDIVIIGTASLFAISVIKNKINYIALFIIFLLLFLSGGRTVTIGVIFSILIFAFLFHPRYFIYLAILGGLFIITTLIFLPDSILQGQLARLTHFRESSFMGQDASRGLAWELYLKNFFSNPIFGKGISTYQDYFYYPDLDNRAFALAQQVAGGHGSYFSVLSTYGMGGIIYFVLMLFGGIVTAFVRIRKNINSDGEKSAISVFIFMILLMKAVDYITAGNGLSVPILFFSAGFIAAIGAVSLEKKSIVPVFTLRSDAA